MRLLPVTAIALTLVLGLKLAGVASLFGMGAARAEDKPAEHAPASEAAPADKPPEKPGDKPAAKPADDAAGDGQTASEADVLESLAARREQLDERERALDMREKIVGAAEKRIEERIGELKEIEARVETMFAQRDEQEQKQLVSLIKTFEAMKPADAAEIFNTLNRTVLLDVVTGMKPAKVAPILAAMKPDMAQEVTVALAERFSVPRTAQAGEDAAAPPESPKPAGPVPTPEANPPAAPPAAPGG